MSNQFYPFGSAPGSTGTAYLPFDLEIREVNPGLFLNGTEPNAVYWVKREVAGCVWEVINADYNSNAGRWEQRSPQNPATAAYAIEMCDDGTIHRYVANPTLVPGTPVTWVEVWRMDPKGNTFVHPTTFTSSAEIGERITLTWNSGLSTKMDARVLNVADLSSDATSNLDALLVNGTARWVIDKSGTLTAGTIPFSRISGYTPPVPSYNNITFTGTTTFNGPIVANDSFNGQAITGTSITSTGTIYSTGNANVGSLTTGNVSASGIANFQFLNASSASSFGGDLNVNGPFSANSTSTLQATSATSLTINGALNYPIGQLDNKLGVAGGLTKSIVGSQVFLDGSAFVQSITSSDNSVALTRTGSTFDIKKKANAPGAFYRVFIQPPEETGGVYPRTATISIPALPGDGTVTYALYAHCNVNLNSSATMTLTGGTGSWATANTQNDAIAGLQPISLSGTCTGGQSPSVSLYISGVSTNASEGNYHATAFILEASPI